MLLSGCANTAASASQGQAQPIQEKTITQKVSQPLYQSEVNYEIPVSRVKVLVDRGGYLTQRDKKVLFLGEDLSEEFRIVEEKSKEVVYKGKITGNL